MEKLCISRDSCEQLLYLINQYMSSCKIWNNYAFFILLFDNKTIFNNGMISCYRWPANGGEALNVPFITETKKLTVKTTFIYY